jgi:hypothetical protein
MSAPLVFAPAPLLDRPYDHELTQLAMGLRKVVKREFVSARALTEIRGLGWYARTIEGTYDVDTASAEMKPGPGAGYCTVFLGDRAAVDRACALELIERGGRGRERREAMAELGGLLGYPACCVAAYLDQREHGEDASFARLFAAGPREGAPRWNNLFVLSHSLISHFPCTLACETTAELAGATWSHLAKADEARGTAVATLLAARITVWDRFLFIVDHPDHGRLTAHQLDGSPHLLSHGPLISFVQSLDATPPGGVRLQFR